MDELRSSEGFQRINIKIDNVPNSTSNGSHLHVEYPNKRYDTEHSNNYLDTEECLQIQNYPHNSGENSVSQAPTHPKVETVSVDLPMDPLEEIEDMDVHQSLFERQSKTLSRSFTLSFMRPCGAKDPCLCFHKVDRVHVDTDNSQENSLEDEYNHTESLSDGSEEHDLLNAQTGSESTVGGPFEAVAPGSHLWKKLNSLH